MTGSLQVKKDKYYAVISYKDTATHKWKQKWVSTDIAVSGNNIRKANKALQDIMCQYSGQDMTQSEGIYFTDYIKLWLETAKMQVDTVTWQGYESYVRSHIAPYFDPLKLKINGVTPQILQGFYNSKFQAGRLDGKGGLSGKTVKKFHVVIHQVLKDAVWKSIIPYNPDDRVTLPKLEPYEANFYTAQEVHGLVLACENEPLKALIMMTVYYGLRRSEVLGIKWDAIDFENNLLTVKHTVVRCTEIVKKDKTKNQSSHRSYPLITEIKEFLIEMKHKEDINRTLFGNTYIESDYIFKWDNGKPFSPDYVTRRFHKILVKGELPLIRFHDLRHSCASLLIAMGYSLRDIQEWLGHSDIKITGIYIHLDVSRKKKLAEDFGNIIQF